MPEDIFVGTPAILKYGLLPVLLIISSNGSNKKYMKKGNMIVYTQ